MAALLLSARGLYGVLSFFVAESQGELAIRSALGATSGKLIAHVVGEGLRPLGAGVALGTFACLLLGSTPAAQLEVDLFDLRTIVVVAQVLALSALLATWLPALKAIRHQPATELRRP